MMVADGKTQDESQWIVSQRILSALTIPGSFWTKFGFCIRCTRLTRPRKNSGRWRRNINNLNVHQASLYLLSLDESSSHVSLARGFPMNLFHAVGQDLKFLDGRLWHFEVKWDE